MRPAPGVFSTALLGLLSVGGPIGCSEFNTRPPEDPNSAASVPLRARTDPDSVLENVRLSFEHLSSAAYDPQVGELFTFVGDPTDASNLGDPTLFDNWDRDVEISAISEILDQARSENLICTFTWGTRPALRNFEDDDPPVSGKWYENLTYQIVFSSGPRRATYSGKVDLYLIESNALWVLYRWTDKIDGSANHSSGWLRGKRLIE